MTSIDKGFIIKFLHQNFIYSKYPFSGEKYIKNSTKIRKLTN